MTISDDYQDLPERLAARPRDPRGYPIPYVQGIAPDGTPDFTAVDALKAWTAGEERRCGLCGESMSYWVAFVGGPDATGKGAFLDPPMHPDCAEAAMRLCPHMAVQARSRATKHKASDVATPPGFKEDKPEEWCIYITRQYRQELIRGQVDGQIVGYVFLPRPAKQIRRFRYDEDGKLTHVKEFKS